MLETLAGCSASVLEKRAPPQKRLMNVDTAGDGDCLFNAVRETVDLLVIMRELRNQICDCVSANSRFFQSSCVGGTAGLERHVQRTREAGTWATGIEVAAAAHLLLRPLHLVTDNVADAGSTLVTEPPEVIAASAWGDPIYLAHFLQWHFEGTVARTAQGCTVTMCL